MHFDSEPRPPSATHGVVAAVGLAAFLLSISIIRADRPFGDNIVNSALFVIGGTAGAIFLIDLIWQKVHLRASTGIDFSHDDPSRQRRLSSSPDFLAVSRLSPFSSWFCPSTTGITTTVITPFCGWYCRRGCYLR